jgi:hypothetical protein
MFVFKNFSFPIHGYFLWHFFDKGTY